MNRRNLSESTLIAMAQESIDRHPGSDDADGDEWLSLSAEGFEELIRKVLHRGLAGECSPQSDSNTVSNNAEDDFPEGSCLGRFKLIRPLGHGGFGVVLLAFDPKLERHVALKLPRPELLGRKTWRKQFIHEARAAAALDHPNIVKLHDIGRSGPVLYLASSFCDGPTLAEWMRQYGPVSPREAATLIAQVADAVQHAHSRGVLHRDLKPANILLKVCDDVDKAVAPVPQITDFGLASRRHKGTAAEYNNAMAGTMSYMAPEQACDDPANVGTATDVYALGGILFELVAGRPPFQAKDSCELVDLICHSPPPELRTVRPGTPRDLAAICAKCLAKNPSDRYESAAALAHDLRRFLTGECVEARPANIAERSWRWCARRPAIALLAVTLFVAIVGGSAASFVQWRRAERNLVEATYNAALARENIQRANEALLNLGWAIDDAVLWQDRPNDRISEELQTLSRRYAAALSNLGQGDEARELMAAELCLQARLASMRGDQQLAQVKFRKSLTLWRELVREDVENSLHRRALSRTLYCYGIYLLTIEQQSDGMAPFDDGVFFCMFSVADSADRALIFDYANVLFDKAAALRKKEYHADAARHYSACLAICNGLIGASADDANSRFRALQCRDCLSGRQGPDRSRAATFAAKVEILHELRGLAEQYPTKHDFQWGRAKVALWLALHAEKSGIVGETQELLDEAITSLALVLGAPNPAVEAKREMARALSRKAVLAVDSGNPDSAIQLAKDCLKWIDAATGNGATQPLLLARTYRSMGSVFLKCGAERYATKALERAAHDYESACDNVMLSRGVYLQHSDVWSTLASLYEKSGRIEKAQEAMKESIRVLEKWRGPEPAEPLVAARLFRLRLDVARLANNLTDRVE